MHACIVIVIILSTPYNRQSTVKWSCWHRQCVSPQPLQLGCEDVSMLLAVPAILFPNPAMKSAKTRSSQLKTLRQQHITGTV